MTRKNKYFPIFAVILSLTLVIGVPEIIIRIINPTLQQYRAILFGGDSISPKLFMNDPWLNWRLRPNIEVTFINTVVRTNEFGFRGKSLQKNKKSVLCIGDSTIFGWKVSEESTFVQQLEQMLNRSKYLSDNWQTINAGVPGYTSFQVSLMAKRIFSSLKPDYVVLCVGNNEAWPAKRSDYQLYKDRYYKAKVLEFLSHSTLFLFLKELFQPGKPQQFKVQSLSKLQPKVSRDEYIQNIKDVISLTNQHQITLILMEPPVNLLFPPLRMTILSDLEVFKRQWTSVIQLIENNEIDRALKKVDEYLTRFPDRFYLLWLRGIILTKNGELEKGKALLERAIEVHPFPGRCKPSYRKALKDLAENNKIVYLDTNELLSPFSDQGNIDELYIDWCHPTIKGHEIISKYLFRIVGEKEMKKYNKTDRLKCRRG